MPRSLRTLTGWVLSYVTAGTGSYRHADGRVEPIGPGSLTIVPPGVPHTYGTARGRAWTELHPSGWGPFVVGAGDENRTRVASLEDWGSTIELHPRARRTASAWT